MISNKFDDLIAIGTIQFMAIILVLFVLYSVWLSFCYSTINNISIISLILNYELEKNKTILGTNTPSKI